MSRDDFLGHAALYVAQELKKLSFEEIPAVSKSFLSRKCGITRQTVYRVFDKALQILDLTK